MSQHLIDLYDIYSYLCQQLYIPLKVTQDSHFKCSLGYRTHIAMWEILRHKMKMQIHRLIHG